MNIVGILVQFRPERAAIIRQQIIAHGCEVHLTTPEGKMVITLEHDEDAVIANVISMLQNIEGVLTASLVYHHTAAQSKETLS